MESLRKVKVIFNKKTENEKVLEFIINKVTETHEGDQLTCEVSTEGLAFNELGKIGYKYSLSQDEYDLFIEKKSKEDTDKTYVELVD